MLSLPSEPIDAMQSLLTHADDGMACFDHEHRLLWANPPFAKALGTTVEQLLGDTLADLDARIAPLLPETTRAGPRSPFVDCAAAPPARPALTLHMACGEVHELRGAEGPRGGFNAYLRDITRAQAQERQRSEFLSVAAHELRNPVASIFGFAELLRSRKLKPEGLVEVTDILCRQAGSLSHLVEELLDLARVDAKRGQDFHLQTVSLNTLIQEAREALPAALQPQRIHVRVAASADQLRVDRAKTLRVLINVLSNALKYSPTSTPVELRAQRLKGIAAPEMVDIVVSDRGIGMSTEQQARIFERFYRANPSGPIPGTGLGMSLVQEIVALHGGQVSVQSALGQGCSIQMRLPLASTPAKDLKATRGSQQRSAKEARTNPQALGQKQGA